MESQSSDRHPPQPGPEGAHLLVVIDHREARIYKTDLKASVPERITPFDPHGFGRYLHSVTDDSNGQRKPERKSFYEAVAKSLKVHGTDSAVRNGHRREQRHGAVACRPEAPSCGCGPTHPRLGRGRRASSDGRPVAGPRPGVLQLCDQGAGRMKERTITSKRTMYRRMISPWFQTAALLSAKSCDL
jgi:hypothetical protein